MKLFLIRIPGSLSFFASVIDYNAISYIMKYCKNEDFVFKMIASDMANNKYVREEQSLNKLIPLLTSSLEMINCKSSLGNDLKVESFPLPVVFKPKPIYIAQSLTLPPLPVDNLNLSHFLYLSPIFYDFSSYLPPQTASQAKSDFPKSYYNTKKSPRNILIEIRVKDNDDDLISMDDSLSCIFTKHNPIFSDNQSSEFPLTLASSYLTTVNYHEQSSFLNDEVKITLPFQSRKSLPISSSTAQSTFSTKQMKLISPSFALSLNLSSNRTPSFSNKFHILFTFYNLSVIGLYEGSLEEEKDNKKVNEGFSFINEFYLILPLFLSLIQKEYLDMLYFLFVLKKSFFYLFFI
jgi:hypothetical protein